jgi:hypothetical protein
VAACTAVPTTPPMPPRDVLQALEQTLQAAVNAARCGASRVPPRDVVRKEEVAAERRGRRARRGVVAADQLGRVDL